MAHTLHAVIEVFLQGFLQPFFIFIRNQAEQILMLTDNAHKISFRDKVQHPEPGLVELLGLKHLPQLLTPDSRKPYGVHLRVHAVKLLRLKARFPDNSPLRCV